MKRSTFIMYAGFRYRCSSLFFSHIKGEFGAAGGPLSDTMALKKNTFAPTELSVRAALGSLYLYTPQGALPRKVALKPDAVVGEQAVSSSSWSQRVGVSTYVPKLYTIVQNI